MPREPRMYLPGVPCHVIQRGNNQAARFFYVQDYRFTGTGHSPALCETARAPVGHRSVHLLSHH